MPFNETRYFDEFIKKLRGAHSLPDDLLARYAITLPAASDSEIAAQVKAVRAYWNKSYQGKSHAAQVARLCRAEDERLRAEHGASMETRAWWEEQQSKRRSAAEASILVLTAELKQRYSQLGVVTASAVDGIAAKLGLSGTDARQSVKKARLRLVDDVRLPDHEPIPTFQALLSHMSECGVSSVPNLVHPGAGPFSLLDRYLCHAAPAQRLDVAAVDAQITEFDKRGISATDDARRAALNILRRVLREGVDLRDVALYHLVTVVENIVPVSAKLAADRLEKLGLHRDDAVVIAVVLADQSASTGAAGLAKVRDLLASGRLNEARQATLTLASGSNEREDAIRETDAARERLEALLAEVRRVLAIPDEARASALLREAAAISAEDAEEALSAVPLAPPAAPRAVCEGAMVKLFWQPAPGHDDATTYVVCRTPGRAPAAIGDGTTVYRDRMTVCTDDQAPVARALQYGIFALAEGRPSSRAAVVPVTLVPPVSRLEADVRSTELTLHWSAHPAMYEVRVMRTTPGMPKAPVPVKANTCHLTGLPQGQAQHFEVTAVYRGLGGSELVSPVEQISATPRAQARPVERLRVRPIEAAGGLRVRVAWTPVGESEVRIMRADSAPAWQFGTWVSPEAMAKFGTEVTGRRITGRSEIAIEAELPRGVHHLVPFSVGGTGIVVGRSAAVGVTDPVRHLVVTPFDGYATVSWEWPTAQLAEVSWELDSDADSFVIGMSQYRSQGGARVPLGRGPYTVEVRAVIMAGGVSFMSPPVRAEIRAIVEPAIRYALSPAGLLGGRSKRLIFTSEEGCSDVRVRLVASPGRVMPTNPDRGVVLLDTDLRLKPGIPFQLEQPIAVPRQIRKPYWLRCFIVAGRGRLIDPPVSSLKEG